MAVTDDLLDRPTYALGQAARLLDLPTQTLRRWLFGYRSPSGNDLPPVLRVHQRDDELVTWGEFVESWYLREYRNRRIPLQQLREVVDRLRDSLGTPYPFARERPYVMEKTLVRQIEEDIGLPEGLRLIVLRNDQLVLAPAAEQFVERVEFEDDIAARVRPGGPGTLIVIDPQMRFGDPTIQGTRTRALAEPFFAGEEPERIAEMFALPVTAILEAIRWEGQNAA